MGVTDEWKVLFKGQYLTGSVDTIKSIQFKVWEKALLKVKKYHVLNWGIQSNTRS